MQAYSAWTRTLFASHALRRFGCIDRPKLRFEAQMNLRDQGMRRMKVRLGTEHTACGRTLLAAVLGLIFAGVCAHALSQSPMQAAEGTQQYAKLGEFKLQSGDVIHDFRLGYRTLGKLNAEKSNAVLWPTWLGGRSEDLLQFIGPGNVVDSGKYFVILVDAIGDGISTSHSNNGSRPWLEF